MNVKIRLLLTASFVLSASTAMAATAFPSNYTGPSPAKAVEDKTLNPTANPDAAEPKAAVDVPQVKTKTVPDAPAAKDNEVSVELEEVPVVTPVMPGPRGPQLLGETATPVLLTEKTTEGKKTEETIAADKALREALAYVYERHPQLLAEREKVKSIDEGVAQAVSDFRPTAVAGYDRGRERRSTNGGRWTYGDTDSKGLVVDQPIFSGLDGVAGLKAAKQRVKAARADLTALEQQVLFNALVAFTGVVEAQSVLLLNQNNVDVLNRQREAAQVRFDVGELTKTDVSQAEARLAVAKADEQQALGDVAVARATYLRAVGMAIPENISMPEVPTSLPQSLEEASAMARAASPILDAARHRERAFASDVNVRTGAVIPDVSLQGSMNRIKGGSTFANKIDTDAVVLNVTIPLYQSGAEWSRIREARNLASQAKFATLDTTLAVEQDVTSAWQNYVTSGSVITSTQAAAKAGDLALEGVRSENEFGVRTVLDVLDAEQEYMNTKVNLVRAIRNHKIQAYRLLASIGKLTAGE